MAEKQRSLSRKKAIIGAIVLLVGFILLAIFVSITSAAVFALFVLALVLKIDNGVAIVISLALLALSPILLILNQQSAAQALAVWAFYFFSIAVVLQFIAFVKTDPGKKSAAD